MIEKVKEKIRKHELLFSIKAKLLFKTDIARIKERQKSVYDKLYKKYKTKIDSYNCVQKKVQESNYVWICWLQGLENAPDLVKACINSVKSNIKNKQVVVITNDNVKEYIEFPKQIIEKFNAGIITYTHYSDLIRTELMCKYGGIWIDSTVLCTSNKILDILSEKDFFVFKELDLSRTNTQTIIASSWFIYSKYKENPIMMLTRELLYQYWLDYNYLLDYFTFHLFFTMAARKFESEWDNIATYNNHSPHVLMFELDKTYSEDRWNQILEMSSIHKLQRHNSYENIKCSNYNHILELYLEEKMNEDNKENH